MSELWTEDPRLTAVYDAECVGRRDHAFYVKLAHDVGVRSIVDIGCGTGVLAVELSRRGWHVLGADPAAAMLDIARGRPGGGTVEWIYGDAADVPSDAAELVIMTGHVAQYFIADAAWARLLGSVHRILTVGGQLAFETRNPAIDWAQRWTCERTKATYPHPEGGEFTAWVELVELTGVPESYETVHAGHTVMPDGTHLTRLETLRFRSAAEVLASLEAAAFDVVRTCGDWDGSPATHASDELIVLARRR